MDRSSHWRSRSASSPTKAARIGKNHALNHESNRLHFSCAVILLLTSAPFADAASLQNCRAIADDRARLACYDSLAGPPPATPTDSSASPALTRRLASQQAGRAQPLCHRSLQTQLHPAHKLYLKPPGQPRLRLPPRTQRGKVPDLFPVRHAVRPPGTRHQPVRGLQPALFLASLQRQGFQSLPRNQLRARGGRGLPAPES